VAHKDDFPKFSPDIYNKIVLNDLVIYSIYFLDNQGVNIAAEDIISACFTLFPKRFSLRKYPHWPDSAIVSRRWSECRTQGLIVGDTSAGFKLTSRGLHLAGKVEKKLGIVKPTQKKKVQRPARTKKRIEKTVPPVVSKKPRVVRRSKAVVPLHVEKTQPSKPIVQPAQIERVHPAEAVVSKEAKARAGKFVHMMERSDAFVQYRKNGHSSKISEFDFRSLLLCTMESSAETLARNVELFKGYANIQKRSDLVTFLTFCEENFSSLLRPQIKQPAMKVKRSKSKL